LRGVKKGRKGEGRRQPPLFIKVPLVADGEKFFERLE